MKAFTTMTSAAALLYAVPAAAQTCTVAPSCADLGYTESAADCNGSKYIKCPFDATKVTCITPTPAVGDLKYSWQTKDHDGWLLCNGRTISSSTYPQLYSLVGSTLPNYSGYFLKAASVTSTSTFKTAQAAGLPNITGTISPIMQHRDFKGSGAFSSSYRGNNGKSATGNDSSSSAWWYDNGAANFDASKYNSIYGKSTTVTPQNYSANVFIYAGKADDVCVTNGYVSSTAGMYDCTAITISGKTCYKGCKSSQLLEQCKGTYKSTAISSGGGINWRYDGDACYYADDCRDTSADTYYKTSELSTTCAPLASDLIKQCTLNDECMSEIYSESATSICTGVICATGYYCSANNGKTSCVAYDSSGGNSGSTGGSTADSCSCDERDSICSC